MDYQTIQRIAQGVVDYSAACDGQLFTGTVTSAKPLSIKLGDESGAIELDGDDIILTESVVSKKLYIKKHTHNIGAAVGTHTHAIVEQPCLPPAPAPQVPIATCTGTTINPTEINAQTEIVDRTLEAWVTEYGHKLPVDPEAYNPMGEEVVITINRGLDKGDKVVMSRVSHGQQFIVLSRYFEVDNQGDDDK